MACRHPRLRRFPARPHAGHRQDQDQDPSDPARKRAGRQGAPGTECQVACSAGRSQAAISYNVSHALGGVTMKTTPLCPATSMRSPKPTGPAANGSPTSMLPHNAAAGPASIRIRRQWIPTHTRRSPAVAHQGAVPQRRFPTLLVAAVETEQLTSVASHTLSPTRSGPHCSRPVSGHCCAVASVAEVRPTIVSAAPLRNVP